MSLVYLQQESTPPQKQPIWALAWTPHSGTDSEKTGRLLSGGADGVLRIIDSADLSLPIAEINHPLAISSLSYATDAELPLALSTSLDGTVVLSDVAAGTAVGRIETGREAAVAGEPALAAYTSALHPSGSAWAWSGRAAKVAIRTLDRSALEDAIKADAGEAANGAGVGPLSGTGGKVVDGIKGRFGLDVQFSPDGAQLALSTESGHVHIIDVETQTLLTSYAAHAMPVRSVSWSPDSQWVYSGSDDARIVIHDVRAGGSGAKGEGAVAILQGHSSWVLSTAASPDAKLLGTASADKTVKLWDIGQRTCVSTSSLTDDVWGVAWQPEVEGGLAPGKQFAAAGGDGMVTLYRAAGTA